MWAWKHPHREEGTVTYTKLTGDVRFFDVDFAYEEGKTVLHNDALCETGTEGCICRFDRSGKDDDHESDQPFL